MPVNFLMTHPKISMVAVSGVPDRRMGEAARAFVKLKEGYTATEEGIITFAMTATGKMQKFVLKDTAVGELGLDKQ